MKLLTEHFYRDLNPLFIVGEQVLYSQKAYSGEFGSKFYVLDLSTGMISDATLMYQSIISSRMLSLQISEFEAGLSSERVSDDDVYLKIQRTKADIQTAVFTSTGANVLKLPLKNSWNLNFRVLEGLILVLTGKIDGNQFVQGLVASRDNLGLSERKFELVKSGKVMRLFTGGVVITDADGNDIWPVELLKR